MRYQACMDMDYRKHNERMFQHWLSGPFIYMMIIPLLILHFFLEVYHAVCFRLYGLPLVRRADYIRIDRHRLKYLTKWERLHCAYCGYANGLMGYGTKIAADTEKYWCGIKHKTYDGFHEPSHHKDFLPYGDKSAFLKRYEK
jgi:hypothetical protein